MRIDGGHAMVPETLTRLRSEPIRTSAQWTPEQYEWLQARMRRLGLRSVSAVIAMMVQEAMNAEATS